MGKPENQFADDVDGLFRLPLAEFTSARNELAARLKKGGHADLSAMVKGLGKPSVSAWAVNQLYWNHRSAFDKLLASGEKFHKAQASRSGAKVTDMRAALDARREALTELSNLATAVLKDGDHNPSPDTLHRITTTLEGISAHASRTDGPQPGRLTHDVDPPGFESVGAFVPPKRGTVGVVTAKQNAESRQKNGGSTKHAKVDEPKVDKARETKIAAAKAALQKAKKSLAEAQTRARSLAAAKIRSQAELKLAEKRLKEATARAQRVEEDLEEAETEVNDTELALEKASKELDALDGK